jgi:hypothetical protein
VSVLEYAAPIANAAPMPRGWTDAAGVLLLGFSERLRASVAVLLLALPPAPSELELEAAYIGWCDALERGERPPPLLLNARMAIDVVRFDPVRSVVWRRCLALAELPFGEVPTFSSVVQALRPTFRAMYGRDARVSAPDVPPDPDPWYLLRA